MNAANCKLCGSTIEPNGCSFCNNVLESCEISEIKNNLIEALFIPDKVRRAIDKLNLASACSLMSWTDEQFLRDLIADWAISTFKRT